MAPDVMGPPPEQSKPLPPPPPKTHTDARTDLNQQKQVPQRPRHWTPLTIYTDYTVSNHFLWDTPTPLSAGPATAMPCNLPTLPQQVNPTNKIARCRVPFTGEWRGLGLGVVGGWVQPPPPPPPKSGAKSLEVPKAPKKIFGLK